MENSKVKIVGNFFNLNIYYAVYVYFSMMEKIIRQMHIQHSIY